MTPVNSTIEIRTLAEINEIYTVDPECILTKETYSIPVRPYRLIKTEAKCQYLKKGKPCATDHAHGFVVERTDGKLVLLGNCCAYNHLGLDDEQVVGRFKAASATERQNIRRHKIERMLDQRTRLIERVKAGLKLLREVQGEANLILVTLPPQVVTSLLDRWKRDAVEVEWQYLIIKQGKDDQGKREDEKKWHRHSYGKIRGLGLWLDLDAQGYSPKLYEFLKQVEGIPIKKNLSQAELDRAEATFNDVSGLSVIERDLALQSRLLQTFVEPANLLLSIQLFANQDLRAKTVEAVHTLLGQPCKTAPERFVADIDQALQRQYSANGIRIAS
jgi:hypothetical protein